MDPADVNAIPYMLMGRRIRMGGAPLSYRTAMADEAITAAGGTPTSWACTVLKTQFAIEAGEATALAAAGLAADVIAATVGPAIVPIANMIGYPLTVDQFAASFASDIGANLSSDPWKAAGQIVNVVCTASGGDPMCAPDGS